jgi:glutaredoxin
MIVLYSKPNCSYCDRAKQILKSWDITYDTVDITVNPELRDFLINEGHKSVPQLYSDGKLFLGGTAALNQMTKEEFQERLKDL